MGRTKFSHSATKGFGDCLFEANQLIQKLKIMIKLKAMLFILTVFLSANAFSQYEDLLVCNNNSNLPMIKTKKAEPAIPLISLDKLDISSIESSESVNLSVISHGGGRALQVQFDASDPISHFILPAPTGHWDLSGNLYVAFDVINNSEEEILITCRVDGDKWVTGGNVIEGGGSGTVRVIIPQNKSVPDYIREAIIGMNGFPGNILTTISKDFDERHVKNLLIHFLNPTKPQTVTLVNFRAEPGIKYLSQDELESDFFPFVDEFGQYKHAEWEGKVHSVEELKSSASADMADLQAHPGPEDWNKYGGWTKGPQLEGTGHFRVDKYKGKWWIVDPEGRLFWSHGVNGGTGPSARTMLNKREHYFENLPPRDEYPGLYFDRGGRGGPWGTDSVTFYNLSGYNMLRKHGDSWREIVPDIARQRLRSWGMNTGQRVREDQQSLPYSVTVWSPRIGIEGAEGHWRTFPDPFSKEWNDGFTEAMDRHRTTSAVDPYCLGYYVDNELTFNNDIYLAEGTLKSPADQPAKLAFRDHLKKKYRSIAKLNRSWQTDYSSFEAFLVSTVVPTNIESDLREFNFILTRQYLKSCRDHIKQAAPNKMYMGARWDFHLYPHEDSTKTWMLKIAGDYCDLLSFNRYRYSCKELVPPEGVDLPILISEWHIGTLDRGMLHTGLRGAISLDHQQKMYKYYVNQALENPYIVGTHWFQYGEQALTGRGDGENYRIGLVDALDQPYYTFIKAIREIGYNLYKIRTGEDK